MSGGAKRAESKGKGHSISHTQSNRSKGSLLSENRFFRQHRASTDLLGPYAEVLLFGFYWHEAHRRPRHCLTDRSGIVGVILTALETGHQFVQESHPATQPRPPNVDYPRVLRRKKWLCRQSSREISGLEPHPRPQSAIPASTTVPYPRSAVQATVIPPPKIKIATGQTC